jgi:hypothetical protein
MSEGLYGIHWLLAFFLILLTTVLGLALGIWIVLQIGWMK